MIAPWSEITALSSTTDSHTEHMRWTMNAHELWKERLEGALWQEQSLITGYGTFLIANSKSAPIEDLNIKAIENELIRFGAPYQHLDSDDVPGLAPTSSARPHSVIHIPDEFTVDARALLDWSKAQLLSSPRIDFIDREARPLVKNGNLLGVITRNGTVTKASAVLVAAGVASRRILPVEVQAEIPPIIPGAGSSVVLRPVESIGIRSCIRTPNRAFACGLHILPTGGGDLYVGATNNILPGPWSRPSVSDIEFLSQSIRTQVNQSLSHAGVIRILAGNRPISADGAPVVGSTSISGLHVMTGTYRDGLTQSSALGPAVASEILGNKSDIPDVWRPGRTPTSLSSEAVVQSVVANQLATLSEHEIELSHAGAYDEISSFYFDHASKNLKTWGPVASYINPEVLTFVDFTGPVGREIFGYFEKFIS